MNKYKYLGGLELIMRECELRRVAENISADEDLQRRDGVLLSQAMEILQKEKRSTAELAKAGALIAHEIDRINTLERCDPAIK